MPDHEPDHDKAPTHWAAGLEKVGACPHCGCPVYVRPDGEKGISGLPAPVYMCACRTISTVAHSWWNTPAAPPVAPAPAPAPMPWRLPNYPCTPGTPAIPASPLYPQWTPNYEGPAPPGLPPTITCERRPDYDDPTHPGLPPQAGGLNRPGGDY